MTPVVVNDILAVGESPTLEQIEILAKAGFKSIINNQPDGEVERLPDSGRIAEEARRFGLGHAYAPVTSRTPSQVELSAFAKALATLPAPIYAFCYSGARSAAASAFLLTAEQDVDTICAEFQKAGYDVSSLRPWLEDERRHRAPPVKANSNGAHAANGHANGASTPGNGASPLPTPAPATAAQALQGIVVHARARGYSSFAV